MVNIALALAIVAVTLFTYEKYFRVPKRRLTHFDPLRHYYSAFALLLIAWWALWATNIFSWGVVAALFVIIVALLVALRLDIFFVSLAFAILLGAFTAFGFGAAYLAMQSNVFTGLRAFMFSLTLFAQGFLTGFAFGPLYEFLRGFSGRRMRP